LLALLGAHHILHVSRLRVKEENKGDNDKENDLTHNKEGSKTKKKELY